MADSKPLLHAALGAVVTIVLSFVPFSPVLGGGVAAYLERASPADGIRAGLLAGVFAIVPFALFGLVVVGLAVVGSDLSLVFLLAVLVAAALYTMGLSALGGFLGGYVVREFAL